MANLEGMKEKFIVIKIDDAEEYLSIRGKATLSALLDVIQLRQKEDGKKLNKYLVINTDEPYADEVVNILKKHGHWG